MIDERSVTVGLKRIAQKSSGDSPMIRIMDSWSIDEAICISEVDEPMVSCWGRGYLRERLQCQSLIVDWTATIGETFSAICHNAFYPRQRDQVRLGCSFLLLLPSTRGIQQGIMPAIEPKSDDGEERWGIAVYPTTHMPVLPDHPS